MSRLYKYARSNEKSGYYIIGDNGSATFQCRPIVERLFRKLDYAPPVKTEGQGPQIPSTLHWHLFDLEWLYTGENTATPIAPNGFSDEIESGQSLTDEMLIQIQEFADEVGDREGQKLAERFDFPGTAKETQKDRLSEIDVAGLSVIEVYLFDQLSTALSDTADEPLEALKIKTGRIGSSETVLNVSIHSAGDNPNFIHILGATRSDGINGIWSRTDGRQTLKTRSQIDIHRGHIFDCLHQISNDSSLEIEFDQQELEGPFEHSASFEADLHYSDDMREV